MTITNNRLSHPFNSYIALASIAERDAITAPNRTSGMHVYVLDTNSTYVLQSNLTTWVRVEDVLDGYANRNLSNLSNVEINTSLIPKINDGYSLGNATFKWKDGYISNVYADSLYGIPIYENLNIPRGDGYVEIDFTAAKYQTITNIDGYLDITTTNRAPVMSVTIFLESTSIRALTFPGSWRWLGSAAPTQLEANVLMVITLTARGTAESDVIAAAASEV